MAKNVSLAAILLGLCASVSLVQAQDAILSELYGRGVHAFHAGKYDVAHDFLSQAIEKGTQDPRCYIFRGLAYTQSGRPEEAAADFKRGAELEAGDVDQFYNVARALQRVQGEVRLTIEKHRNEARIAAQEVAAKRARAKYEAFLNDEQRVLLAPSGAVQPVVPEASGTANVNDPFGAGSTGPAPAGAPATAAAPSAVPAEATTTTDATPPAAGTADPFGATPQPPAADPFGALNTNPPATTAKPADPFAPAAATPPATAPATAGGGSKRGALGGLFRALKGTVPTPSLPGGIPGLPGGPGAGNDPFGAPAGPGGDPFAPRPGGNDPFAPPGGAAPGGDPFGAPPAGADPFGAPPAGGNPPASPPGNDPFDKP